MNEYTAHQHLQPRHCQRVDWSMRQHVDDMRALLRTHPRHGHIAQLMHERGVPTHVQQRVLAGH